MEKVQKNIIFVVMSLLGLAVFNFVAILLVNTMQMDDYLILPISLALLVFISVHVSFSLENFLMKIVTLILLTPVLLILGYLAAFSLANFL